MKHNNIQINYIISTCLTDNQIHNVLIDMWGKTGCVDRAKEIFEKIRQPDRIECEAIQLYYQVTKELIDEGTYICILNGCSHSGLVDEALSIFFLSQIEINDRYSKVSIHDNIKLIEIIIKVL